MKEKKTVSRIAAGLNLLNAVLVFFSIRYFFIGQGAGNMTVAGSRCFRYFTNDSNILAGLASLAVIPFLWKGRVPAWAAILKFTGTVAVTVTLLTVLLFLGPTQGYARMYAGVCLPLHLICPLLSILTLCLPESREPLPKSAGFFGALPVLVYGALYAVLVLITRTWEDFYGFARGGLWYVSLIVMYLLGTLLSVLMARLQRKAAAGAARR